MREKFITFFLLLILAFIFVPGLSKAGFEFSQAAFDFSTAVITGILPLENGGTEADLSATGGANQFVKQSSAGAALSVGTISDADVPNALTISGGTINNTVIGGTTSAAGTFTTVTTGQINGLQGDELLIQVPDMSAASDDPGFGIHIAADDGGTLSLGGAGGSVTISAGNAVAGLGDANGGNVSFEVGDFINGGDRGAFSFADNDAHKVLLMQPVNGAGVNYIQIQNAVTTAGPTISTIGSDANVDLNLTPQGTGKVVTTKAINASGGGFLTGTWSDLGTVTTVDINGGTLDGTIIGGAAAAAATVTTLSQNNLTTFTDGAAITAGSYQCGRDNDATNQYHCNVPTGASFEFSVNDAATLNILSSGANMNNKPIDNIGSAGTDFGGNGQLTIGHAGLSAGVTMLTINNGPNTAITAVQPSIDINSFTHTLSSGSTIAIGYAATIDPPTYQGVAGGGTETVNDMTTLYLPGPAVVGANLANTSTSTLWVDAGDVRFDGNLLFDPQIVTVASDGAGTPAAFTITPGSGVIQVTCNDTDGCNATMSETGAKNGVTVRIANMSANTVNFADTGGVSELAGAFAAGQYDPITLTYESDRWVEMSRSNN